MTLRALVVHPPVSRSGARAAKGDADVPSSPGALGGGRRWSVKVANVFAAHYGFAISRKPHD
jgi:hypothetical protein